MKEKKVKVIKEYGITLIALVVTIVVLLILAGVSIVVLFGDHGIFGTAQNATTKFGVEAEREKIDNIRIDWWTKKATGEKVTVEDFFEMLQPQIIGDLSDVTGPDVNGTYIVETNNGYTVEVIVDESGNIKIGEITKGNLGPKIVSFELVETTVNSIKVKAEFLSTENANIKYEYRENTENNTNQYIDVTENATNGELTITGLTKNKKYDVRVVVTKEGFENLEETITAEAREMILISELTLNKTRAYVSLGKTKTLIPVIKPENADIKRLEWNSSDETVATVDSNGKITAKKEGNTLITVKTKDGSNQQATCNVTVGNIVSDGSFSEEKGVNTPLLAEGMEPITWKETTEEENKDWVYPSNIDEWYSYTEDSKKWANAITEDGSMWVWIPRYAYQIDEGYHSKTGRTVQIQFMKGTTNTSAQNRTEWDNSSGKGNWNIHPGFEYDTTKPGLWIAKCEASHLDAIPGTLSEGSSNTLQVKPGMKAWTKATASQAYTACFNYNQNLKSHLIKNTEWGACLYLSHSIYGLNDETMESNNSSDYSIIYTCGGTDTQYIERGQRSTTRNVWGIYDMKGCNSEYVAAYVNDENTVQGNRFYNDSAEEIFKAPSYAKDVYEVTETYDYEVSKNMYGDAIYEVSEGIHYGKTWYGDNYNFPGGGSSVFERGNNYCNSYGRKYRILFY